MVQTDQKLCINTKCLKLWRVQVCTLESEGLSEVNLAT